MPIFQTPLVRVKQDWQRLYNAKIRQRPSSRFPYEEAVVVKKVDQSGNVLNGCFGLKFRSRFDRNVVARYIAQRLDHSLPVMRAHDT